MSSPLAAPRRVWERAPLRARLVAILLAALVLALAGTGYGVQLVLREYLVQQIDRQLADAARMVVRSGNPFDLAQPRGRVAPNPLRIQVSADDDAVRPVAVGGYPGGDEPVGVRFPAVSSAEASASGTMPHDVRASDGTNWRAVSIPVTRLPLTDGTSARGSVTVARNLADVESAVARLRLVTLLVGGVVVLLCALLGWLAIRRSFAPLVEVEETAAAIAAGDLSRRIPERPASTEVGRLTRSLNGMLAQIETAFRAREASQARTRRFAADASHELRTPLASIRGFAELYRQGAVPPEEVPRTMRRIEDEAARMGGLVEDLLMLARLDERRPARTEPVDLAVLAGDAVHDVRGLDPQRPVRLTGLAPGSGPAPSVVLGDEGGLRQVVTNLVANAVRHTPAGTPVEVAVGVEPAADAGDGPGDGPGHGTAVLEVRDHGPGLSPEDAERVFERFYRVDSSRRRGAGGGSGLGLSIVAAVTAAHGGTADVRPTPGGGATFRVTFPVAHEPAHDDQAQVAGPAAG
jgi:two-component system OmpR family sensor kinase